MRVLPEANTCSGIFCDVSKRVPGSDLRLRDRPSMNSSDPDGLERVAEDEGFLATAQDALYSILPDYTIPGFEDATLTTILAGLIGVGLVFAIMWGLGALLARRRAQRPD